MCVLLYIMHTCMYAFHYTTLHYIDININIHLTVHHIVLHWTALHYITSTLYRHDATLHSIALHHITLHYIALHYNITVVPYCTVPTYLFVGGCKATMSRCHPFQPIRENFAALLGESCLLVVMLVLLLGVLLQQLSPPVAQSPVDEKKSQNWISASWSWSSSSSSSSSS